MTRVLIVDDEEVVRITLAEILRLEGYEIKTVDSGEAAVEVLNQTPYDVMILDLKMAGMSGIDVLREVVDKIPGLIVIVLTAYGTIDTAIQAIHYRVHDYLLKPVSPEQVLDSIERAKMKKNSADQQASVDQPMMARRCAQNLPGGALLIWDRRQISWHDGSLSLTPTESRLLKILFERKNEMVPHSELVYLIQGYQIETEEAAKILRPVVSRLRQKLTSVPEWDDRIKNVRGAGYVLELN
jgi:DNA-binding response OmpR family regulator